MSRSHIRVSVATAPRKPWLERMFAVGFAILFATIPIFIVWDRPHEPDIISEGKILGTRIVVDNIRHSLFGGRIDYRLEAHVTYNLDGKSQDRWLTADTVSKSRDLIAAQVAGNP